MDKPYTAYSPQKLAFLRGNTVRGLIAVLWIVCFAALALYRLNPPAAVPANAPATEFSSGRAMTFLAKIAQKPHAISLPENAAVRGTIVQNLTALGLQPEIQEAMAITQMRGIIFDTGVVRNIVARIPGTRNTRSVLLVAHYDSVLAGPGASDDGVAVAALIETARAIKAGPPLQNDVILLLTDGEETGSLGTSAFVAEHPWAKNVGVALNFEARGTLGPSIMFEPSAQNNWLIQEFANSAQHPLANSLTYEVYKLLPFRTDFTVFKAAGIKGMNFTFIDGYVRYHTRLDSLQNVNESSLQHHGLYALALARHFGNLDLSLDHSSSGDAVYFDILSMMLVHYPESWALPLMIAAGLLFVGVLVLGFYRKRLTIRGLIVGIVAFLSSLIAAPLFGTLAWSLVKAAHPGYRTFFQGDTYNGRLYLISLAAFAAAITAGLYIVFRKRASEYNLTMGALLWWLILVIVSSLFMPGSSYLFTWPLVFSLLALGILFIYREEPGPWVRLGVLSLGTLPGLVLLVPFIYLLYIAMTLNMAAAILLLTVLLIGLVLPHLSAAAQPNQWMLPGALTLVGIIFIIAGSLTASFDAQHPKPDSLFYGLDVDTGQATWGSWDDQLDDWTAQFLSRQPQRNVSAFYPDSCSKHFLHPAPLVSLKPPKADVIDDQTSNGVRTLRLRLTSPRHAPIIAVYANNLPILEAQVNGKRLDMSKNIVDPSNTKLWGFTCHALPAEGLDLVLKLQTSQPVKIRVVDRSDGLPEIPGVGVPTRPLDILAVPADQTSISKSFTY